MRDFGECGGAIDLAGAQAMREEVVGFREFRGQSALVPHYPTTGCRCGSHHNTLETRKQLRRRGSFSQYLQEELQRNQHCI